jgi:glycosyltransferase involved in cell wall biosynthesis
VVVSDHAGAADVVEEGRTGFVVPARSAEALRDRLLALADDRERCAAMGAAAAGAIHRDHGWGHAVEVMCRRYREAFGGAGAADGALERCAS